MRLPASCDADLELSHEIGGAGKEAPSPVLDMDETKSAARWSFPPPRPNRTNLVPVPTLLSSGKRETCLTIARPRSKGCRSFSGCQTARCGRWPVFGQSCSACHKKRTPSRPSSVKPAMTAGGQKAVTMITPCSPLSASIRGRALRLASGHAHSGRQDLSAQGLIFGTD